VDAGETGLAEAVAVGSEAVVAGSGVAVSSGAVLGVGLFETMQSLATEKSRGDPEPLMSSFTVMPGTAGFVTPAISGRALAVEMAPAAITPSPRAEAAPMAIQLFASMGCPFKLRESQCACASVLCDEYRLWHTDETTGRFE